MNTYAGNVESAQEGGTMYIFSAETIRSDPGTEKKKERRQR